MSLYRRELMLVNINISRWILYFTDATVSIHAFCCCCCWFYSKFPQPCFTHSSSSLQSSSLRCLVVLGSPQWVNSTTAWVWSKRAFSKTTSRRNNSFKMNKHIYKSDSCVHLLPLSHTVICYVAVKIKRTFLSQFYKAGSPRRWSKCWWEICAWIKFHPLSKQPAPQPGSHLIYNVVLLQ